MDKKDLYIKQLEEKIDEHLQIFAYLADQSKAITNEARSELEEHKLLFDKSLSAAKDPKARDKDKMEWTRDMLLDKVWEQAQKYNSFTSQVLHKQERLLRSILD